MTARGAALLRWRRGPESDAPAEPPALRLAGRAVLIAATTAAFAVPALLAAGVLAATGRRSAAGRVLARRLVALLQRLGPAFVKGGQIIGTRRDLLPAVLCNELAVLADAVTPMEAAEARSALAEIYGPGPSPFRDVDYTPVASGSVAVVLRGHLADGREVAIKLRRPGIEGVMMADLALMQRLGSVAARLPMLRGTPVQKIFNELCAAVRHQLDFEREAASLQRLRGALASVPRVWVPQLVTDASRERAVVMEFIPDLDVSVIDELAPVARRRLAATTMNAVYQMLFMDGLVHCDLHRGNLYFTHRGQVVVLDAGFSVPLSSRIRRLFAEFFLNMSIGNGEECARIVIESSDGAAPDADEAGFSREMAALVERNHGLVAREFSLIGFATEMFELQRTFGLHAASQIVFPLLSLLVIEGTVRELDPDIDFQEVAKPIVTRAVFGTTLGSQAS